MGAFDLDEEPTPDRLSTARDWLCVVSIAFVVVLTVIVWTFWS